MSRLCEKLGIETMNTGGYSARANGTVERCWDFIGRVLRRLTDEQSKHWEDFIPDIRAAYNMSYRQSHGASPFEVRFGYAPRTATEARLGPTSVGVLGMAQEITSADIAVHLSLMHMAQDEARRTATWHRQREVDRLNAAGFRAEPFAVGDKCAYWLPPSQLQVKRRQRKKKHLPHFHGPATITEKLGASMYRLVDDASKQVYERNFSALLPWGSKTRAQSDDARGHDDLSRFTTGELIAIKDTASARTWWLASVVADEPECLAVEYYGAEPAFRKTQLEDVVFKRVFISPGKAAEWSFDKQVGWAPWSGEYSKEDLSPLVLGRQLTLGPGGKLVATDVLKLHKDRVKARHAVLRG